MPNGELVNFKTVEHFLAAAGEDQTNFDAVYQITPSDAGGQSRQNLPASAKPLDYHSLLLDTIKKHRKQFGATASARIRTDAFQF